MFNVASEEDMANHVEKQKAGKELMKAYEQDIDFAKANESMVLHNCHQMGKVMFAMIDELNPGAPDVVQKFVAFRDALVAAHGFQDEAKARRFPPISAYLKLVSGTNENL